MSARSVVGYTLAMILIGLGILFAWAASVQAASTRLPIALIMIAAGLAAIYAVRRQKPTEIVQRVELSGELKARQVRCPNCSATIDVGDMQVVGGLPTIKCRYCGHTFQVTEEPKW